MLWSSRIFWMVGRVIADTSLDLLSPCGVVPRVPILIKYTLCKGKPDNTTYAQFLEPYVQLPFAKSL
jgi:hypothetical protein